MNKIPIIINNRNLLTWPSEMLEMCRTFENVGDLIIVDNGSTYEPLLEWYKSHPCEIIFTENNGQSSPWIIGLPIERGYDHYVVTDPDLDLSETPKDCLIVLKEKLLKYSKFSKIGLSLSNWKVDSDSPYHYFLQSWAETNWDESTIEDGLLTKQPIDTTFGLYDLKKDSKGLSCSLNFPYSAKHIPWEITNNELKNLKEQNPEYYHYLVNATRASSYKSFVNFHLLYDKN